MTMKTMTSILLKVKNSDLGALQGALGELGAEIEYSYPGTKFSEYLVQLDLEYLKVLSEAVPSLEIIQGI